MPCRPAPGIRHARHGHPRNLLSQLRTEGTDVTDLPTDLTRATAADLADALASKTISSVEVTQAHLDRIAAVDGQVHSYLHVDTDGALAQARAVDERRQAGESLGALAGVPIAVKDVMTTKGVPTTCGSRILEGWIPPYDATVVTKLREAGLPILGKTNMDEFAMGSSTEHSAYGPSRNPWDLDRIPGGSGGGSSSVLASFQAPLATGTDTGGSIRQPAAVTATVGTKPTYGGVSRYGLVALASSLDQAGPCGRTVLDTALLHAVMGGHDPMDSTSIDAPVPAVVEAARAADVRGMRIGVVKELGGEGYQPGVRARFDESVALLEELGAEVVEVSCPNFDYALAAYYLILPSEASSHLAKFDAMRYGLRARRQARGPDGDVPQRHRDHPGQPRRRARHVDPVRPRRRGRPARRHPDPRARDEGRAALLRGRRPRSSPRRPLGRSDHRPRARAGRRRCCEGSLT